MPSFIKYCICNHQVSDHNTATTKGIRKCSVWDCDCKDYIFKEKKAFIINPIIMPKNVVSLNSRAYTKHEGDEIGKKRKSKKIIYISQLGKKGEILDVKNKQRLHETHGFSDILE